MVDCYTLQQVYEEQIPSQSPTAKPIPKTSHLERLFIQLQLKPWLSSRSKEPSYDKAVAGSHSYLCDYYRPGDQIVLVADSTYANDHFVKPLEILARHLHYGTTPIEQSEARPKGIRNVVGWRIPIHGVAVDFGLITSTISSLNDQLKSRFPSGTEHIICSGRSNDNYFSCSTRCGSDGTIVCREVCFYSNPASCSAIFISATKDFIYFKPVKIPDWDEEELVWTRVLNSSPHGTPGMISLDLVLPVGMYRHEIRKYKRILPEQWEYNFKHSDVLVWKSYQN
ncbi:hypothetical protein OPQ81_002642 [Rhizoctonia solani]|nr:hypothetical protein OPQ81_002642 [Rhizoctonia solani]